MTEPSIRVVQLTDNHLYADPQGTLLGVNTEQSMIEVMALARRHHWPADLVLATGDLVHDGSPEGYRRLLEHLEALETPVYCLPGNHDEGEALTRILNRGPVCWQDHLQLGTWQFCFLDSTVPGSEGGHLRASELGRLRENLAAHPGTHALVCLHHQPVTVGSAWLDTMAVDNGEEFLRLLEDFHQVKGVLWGHVHQDFVATHRGIQLLATPSTCVQFLPGSRDFAVDPTPPGYRWLELHADGRIETGVERLAELPPGLDKDSGGY
jgi:Icc protein